MSFFLKKLVKLLDVKSIITLALVFVLCFCVVTNRDMPDVFTVSLGTVLAYFFTKPKSEDSDKGESK